MKDYCPELCAELGQRAAAAGEFAPRPIIHPDGTLLDVALTGVFPAVPARARLRLDKFVGGGFAGQVYRCRLESLEPGDAAGGFGGLEVGRTYAVKLLLPPAAGRLAFRNALYWLAYQGPFAAQVNEDACRAGATLQLLLRRGARLVFGREDAVVNIHATFFDAVLGSFGEISEWVEGRTWHLEQDLSPQLRRAWRTADPAATGSPEYVAKRQFMASLVELLHAMGGAELARQYEWWSMKSQPNVLKRLAAGTEPAGGLCAIDFRAGLALLPFLPMSPVDFKLIAAGLCRRGAIVQFDRIDTGRLEAFINAHPDDFADLRPVLEEFKRRHAAARAAQPDLTRQGLRLLISPELRRGVRAGLVAGYQAAGLVSAESAERLRQGGWRFLCFYLLGLLPFLGQWLRRLWGAPAYRRHCGRLLASPAYLGKIFMARVANRLADWHREGRSGAGRTRFLLRHPLPFVLQRFTLGLLPAGMHRCLAEPGYAFSAAKARLAYLWRFYQEADFREQWLLGEIAQGEAEGMLTPDRAQRIRERCQDPFIVKYLQALAVHFATLPLSEIVTVITAGAAAAYAFSQSGSREKASVAFVTVFAAFQVIPISPGSICRGVYVLYLMLRERNLRSYIIAAPLAFVKGLGYLAFPIQAAAVFPEFSQFMAGRWASRSTRLIPVFGERGALLEHMVFDLFFNRTLMFVRWAAPRLRYLLDAWLIFGAGLWTAAFAWRQPIFWDAAGINLTLALAASFLLPRVLFYPLCSQRTDQPDCIPGKS